MTVRAEWGARGPQYHWTDERIESLRKYRHEGLSAAGIAAALGGGLTRNAVIGKLHRLGLRTEPRAPSPRSHPKHRIKPQGRAIAGSRIAARTRGDPNMVTLIDAIAFEPPLDGAAFDAAIPQSQRRTLLELREGECKWPVGEGAEMFFCAAEQHGSLPYCYHHSLRAYQPAAPRQDRRNIPA